MKSEQCGVKCMEVPESRIQNILPSSSCLHAYPLLWFTWSEQEQAMFTFNKMKSDTIICKTLKYCIGLYSKLQYVTVVSVTDRSPPIQPCYSAVQSQHTMTVLGCCHSDTVLIQTSSGIQIQPWFFSFSLLPQCYGKIKKMYFVCRYVQQLY